MKKNSPPLEMKENKIKNKLFVLNKNKEKGKGKKLKIPKSLIVPAKDRSGNGNNTVKNKKGATMKFGKKFDEKHYHIHLHHHLLTKERNSKANETEPSKQASKVSGVGQNNRAHTESREGISDPPVELAAVTVVNKAQRNKYQQNSKEDQKRRKSRKSKDNYLKNEDSKEES